MRQAWSWHRSGMLAATASSLVGALVALLWILKPESLADRVPVLFMMQFNTALCFVATGLAFGLMLAGVRRTAIVLSLVTAFFCLAVMAQAVVAPTLPLDRLLVPFRATVSRPGHIASGTALSFVLVNIANAVSAATRRPTLLRVVLAATVFMAAAATLLGYALHLVTQGGWPRVSQMSPLTALCFAGLTLSMIFLRVRELGYHRSTIAATLGAASYLLLLVLTLFNLGETLEGGLALPLGGEDGGPRAILAGLLVFSGIVYACLIVYAFRSAQRYRDIAAELGESRKRLAAIIDTAADGVITIDGRGTILSVNRATETIFGYGAGEMLGQNVRMLMPEPSSGEQDGDGDTGRRGRQPRFIGRGREAEGLRKNGLVFPLDLSVARIKLQDHVIYSGIVRDISQRKQHEREILEANAELEEFSYRTAHDLRSPIASSIGLVAIMRDMIGLGTPASEIAPLIDRMDASLQRLDRLLMNILLLTRTRLLEEPEVPLAVSSAVRETIDRLRFIGAGGQIDFSVAIPDDLTITTKASRFQMILDNLLSNAIKYADPKTDTRRVEVEAETRGGLFELRVSDNGLGIDARDEQNLFQMFKRFHPGHSHGSGLGLYILRKSVERLEGTVAFRRLDKGSCFVVRLPLKEHS